MNRFAPLIRTISTQAPPTFNSNTPSAFKVKDKVALVTGAGGGIGRETVSHLLKEGAEVVMVDADAKSLEKAADQLKKAHPGGKIQIQTCDVTNLSALNEIFNNVTKQKGLHIVVNNAGISGGGEFIGHHGWSSDLGFVKTISINLTGVIQGTRLAVDLFKQQKVDGVVVNTASMAAFYPMPLSPVYTATKAGVVGFTRSLQYLSRKGIRVNCICPAFTDTPMVQDQLHNPDFARVVEQANGCPDLLHACDVATGIMMLVQDTSRSGAVLTLTKQKGLHYMFEPAQAQ
eukprot:TRINITY_DN56_c0_g1::TRINITY_DN56_c0_g1_i1::g.14827::m.14827 TRINITY_DN56_c0_g1::TRINITY_DN56_c0_g1_i1::g.14827  ORF type:complete len:297 (-),score=86.03,sp/Q8VCC1/PGDH_MOUSE/33.46/1e-39,adh_short/PF00106.20/1.3e-29,adh_short_C2/PF13561.1/2.4e-16,KR/PF08659.5/9.9e-11,Epimerase/PF01370.16/9.5e-07,Epimerase/PF01370.16/4.3e+02,Polysacc_synt_2/PF02719.10/9.9e-06,Polysacc_synt_2/PF02719.10/1.9e+03,NAD_binding_10/PF13460.1/2e-05,Saccharop_dh/PF03435.13/3.2e-05,3Beta_HSD/PF01073.14/0.00015,3HCDH_N/PF02